MTKTILVIEDDKSVLLLLEDVLKSEGFDVRTERDGEWGLRTFQEKHVDLAIVDVLIPKLKGFDLIAKLRESEKGKHLPIIVISGVYRAANHKERIVQKHRVAEYLDKPVDIDRLIDVLHDVFSSAYPAPGEARAAAPAAARTVPLATKDAAHSPAQVPGSAAAAAAAAAPAAAPAKAPAAAIAANAGASNALPGPVAPSPVQKVEPAIVSGARREVTGTDGVKLAVPDRGTLEAVPFARLLGELFAARVTGQLLAKKGSVKKIVYLRQGIPVFVKSNLVTECLGRVMVAEKLISEEECARSLERKKQSNKRQGQVLVEMGSISPHNLEFALELQLQTKLYDMFSWMEGEYQFVPKDDFIGQAVALSLGPTAMIFEGASRTMSADRIERDLARIHGFAVVPARDPTFRYQALELDPRAERLLDRIDGRRTVKSLLESADFDIEDAALLIYALTCTGLLQTVPAGEVTFTPVEELISVDDADIQVLSTNEIDPAAELAKLGVPLPSPIAAPSEVAQTEPLRSLPSPTAFGVRNVAEHRDLVLGPPAARVDTGAETIDALEIDVEPPVFDDSPPPEVAPVLSEELRRQVRARLDAEAAKLVSQRPQPAIAAAAQLPSAPKKLPSNPKNAPKREAPKLDLERDHARAKQELIETLDRLTRADLYEVLAVARRATPEELERAHQKLARDHHPDRVLAGALSRELRSIAERIALTIERAYDTLSNRDARQAYDRSLGIENGEARIAPLLAAEHAFARGKDLLDRAEFAAAREAFFEATEKSPQEGTYFAYLGLAMFLTAPKDDNTCRVALEALDKAQELAPLNEEVYLFRATLHQKSGNRTEAIREYERALRCNPDCVPALEELRTLEPPQRPKTGFLSRLTSS